MTKTKITFLFIALIAFGIGFFAGMEYNSYRIKTQLNNILPDSEEEIEEKQKTFEQEVKDNNEVVINKGIGETVQLATINIEVISSEEKNILNLPYGRPEIADKDTKFVVVTLSATNATTATFSYEGGLLIDQEGRRFTSELIFLEDGLLYEDLAPSIRKEGKIVFRVPEDSSSYSLIFRKGGTNEVYQIKIK